jgi:hypothetical protein
MSYVIIVCDDNSLYGSCKEKIMQKEKLFNKLWFLVPPHYNGYDMSQCTVTMRYTTPISREMKTEILVLSDEKYEEYLKYILPIDTCFTKEYGDIELNLTFTMLETDNDSNIIQRVRKTDNHILTITQLPNWDAFVPDGALAAIDQKILKTDAQIKALAELADALNGDGNITMVDNLVYDSVEDTLQLSSKGVGIGNKISVREMLEDGAPVVDFNSAPSDTPSTDEDAAYNNVAEF